MYTNLDNLEQTIRQQQAQLLQQQLYQQQQLLQQPQLLRQQHFSLVRNNSRGEPVFKAPPPPSLAGHANAEPLAANSDHLAANNGDSDRQIMASNGHEQSTSFMGSENESRQWEWKVKIRPDGSR